MKSRTSYVIESSYQQTLPPRNLPTTFGGTRMPSRVPRTSHRLDCRLFLESSVRPVDPRLGNSDSSTHWSKSRSGEPRNQRSTQPSIRRTGKMTCLNRSLRLFYGRYVCETFHVSCLWSYRNVDKHGRN